MHGHQGSVQGGSGRLVDDSLSAADLDKSDIFITNVVHCHPPENRKSRRHEIDNCKHYLFEELEILAPQLVIGLGEDAKAALLSKYFEAESLSWKPFRVPESPVAGPEGLQVQVGWPRQLPASRCLQT